MQQLRIGIERHRRPGQRRRRIGSLRRGLRGGLIERAHALDDVFRVDALELGLGHFAEVAEAADDRLQVRDLRAQRRRAFAKDLVELRLAADCARAHQVLDRELQREERILELVRQPARQFAPCGHALALHQAVALAGELLCHVIEAARQHAHFVAPALAARARPSCRRPPLRLHGPAARWAARHAPQSTS